MTPEDFDALFDRFHRTAFRLETLPSYDVGGAEAERIAAMRARRPIPERSVRSDPWLARIALTTVRDGKRWSRVRVMDEPLTDYQADELVAYIEAQAAGDSTSLVSRSQVPGHGPDFWLFDAGTRDATAVVMRYDEQGRWLAAEHVTEPRQLQRLDDRRREVTAKAVPLNVFLAGHRVVAYG